MVALWVAVWGCDREEAPPLAPQGELASAAYSGNVEQVRALLGRGSSPTEKEGSEWTPLHYAAIAGRAEAASLLLDRGADPNARARYDMTPLHWASLKGERDVVALLARRGAKLEAKSMYGQTALHVASTTAVVEVLLGAGAKLDAVDFEGMTPLHIAASGDIAKLLMAKGADVRRRSRDGRSGLDVAVMEMLGPKGLMFYGNRSAVRLRAERAETVVTIHNVSERVIDELSLSVESLASTASSTPALIPKLYPAEQTAMRFHLRRKAEVPEGEYRLDFVVRSGAKEIGTVDLRVDTTSRTTPEDRGMTKLGRGSLRKQRSKWGQLMYAVIPVLIGAIWWVSRGRGRRVRHH
ncbi:MAG: ankyrin repeat domain-containing protein [Deltaproteobacteria bacterium]|nr:ankyrin repeat domain-containing protein [Deltaproteobacteria bacterium]